MLEIICSYVLGLRKKGDFMLTSCTAWSSIIRELLTVSQRTSNLLGSYDASTAAVT